MNPLKLTYFDISGGRAEPARLALKVGGIEFVDDRFPFSDFQEVRKMMPLKQVPVLEVDGKMVTQCNAINRYVAKMAGLYPEDNYKALLCDEILEAQEDVTHKLVATFGLEGEALKNARELLVKGPLTQVLQWTEQKLIEQGGEYFVDNRLTIADLKVFVWVNSLCSGVLDHIPETLVSEVAPKLLEHRTRVMKIPAIASHYS